MQDHSGRKIASTQGRKSEDHPMKNTAAAGLLFWAVVLAGGTASADDWPQWRGPQRTGISKETGLLKSWPADGPKLLWAVETPGKGFGSISVVGKTIYLTGTEAGRAVAYALGTDGKLKWRQVYGTAWTKNFPMSRCQPTIDGSRAYVISGTGWAACLDIATGKVKWAIDLMRKFGGRNITWGLAESPLVVGGNVIFTPGGKDASVVALDKQTGRTAWRSKGLSERAAYCSPMLITAGGKQQIVTQLENHIVGIDARTGRCLWKVPQRNRWAVHPNTPVAVNGMLFISSGYGFGSQLIKLSADGASATVVWREKQLDNHHEGILLVGGYIYGCGSRSRLMCMDPADAKILYKVNEVRKASITCADGRIYAYDEKGGTVSLVEVSPKGYKIRGQFKVTRGSGPHWAHPVVAGGVLYIRHGEALLAYDVKGG
ncbi:MAG: PQQ-like beta-propeller repeat protein [Planctomycetes bacterium]|nr:PQQ-like beta-propeller repeat protein [Planctomycetota bacterium]